MQVMAQRLTNRDTEVIDRAQKKRRSVLHLTTDRDWLIEYATEPRLLLSRMAHRGALIPMGGGRYAIPSLGSSSADRLPFLNLLDAELSPLGPYYLGYWSALNEHQLTDVDARYVTAAIGFSNGRVQRKDFSVAGRSVRVAQLPPALMDFGVETVRISRAERYRRSDLERTLIDCLMRPRLAGSPEVLVSSWGRAIAHDQVRWDVLANHAERLGPRASRRAGALLSLAGYPEMAHQLFPPSTASARTISLIGGSAASGKPDMDAFYRVRITPSREHLEGWLHYGK